jgi:hypothetical protein
VTVTPSAPPTCTQGLDLLQVLAAVLPVFILVR